MQRCMRVLAFVTLMLCGVQVDATAVRQKYIADGSVIEMAVSDSLITLRFSGTAVNADPFAFATQRPELADSYEVWGLSDSFFVFRLESGHDPDQAISSLRALPEVGIVNPVFEGASGWRTYMTAAVMVSFKPGVATEQIEMLNQNLPIREARPNPDGPLQWTVWIEGSVGTDPLEVSNQYFASGLCRFAQPVYVLDVAEASSPDDPLFDEQWHWLNTGQTGGKPGADIDADLAWDVTLPSGPGPVRVAVIDKGFDLSVADQGGSGYFNGHDVVGASYASPTPDNDPSPGCNSDLERCWHGTSVLGVVAAATNNDLGIAGLTTDSPSEFQYVAMKAFDNLGYTTDSLIVNALRTIFYNPTYRSQIIVLPWVTDYNDSIEAALEFLKDDGYAIFAATGDVTNIAFPATSDHVYAVGATNDSDHVQIEWKRGIYWFESGVGSELDFVAPGTWIWTWDLPDSAGFIPYTDNCDGEYDYNCQFHGTSASVAIVAGVAALAMARQPELWFKTDGSENISSVLLGSSEDEIGDDYDTEGFDWYYGYGRVNAYRALLALMHGDLDNDAEITATDLAVLIDVVFYGQHATLDDRTADFDCNGYSDATDIALMVDHLYNGGDGPPNCYLY